MTERPPPWAMRTEPCVCGGSISSANHPAMIAAAVEAHNDTDQHLEWRAVRDLARPVRRHCPCHENGAA